MIYDESPPVLRSPFNIFFPDMMKKGKKDFMICKRGAEIRKRKSEGL